MQSYPKITVITPSFNQGQFIEETILSVLNQKYPNLQYIVIDGGSTDNTINVIKKYESEINYWVSENDNGQSNAINKGLKKAEGEIIAWLNSDDIYFENTLHKVADYFQNNSGCVCLIGRLRFIKEKKMDRLSTPILFETPQKTAGFINLSQPAMFFSKKVFDKIGYLNEQFHYCFDTELWLKIILTNSFKDIKEVQDVFAGFRLHSSSKSVEQESNFIIEKDYLFYMLAKQFNQLKIADTILQLGNIQKNKNTQLVAFDTIDSNLVERALNYYLFYRADQYYFFKDKSKADICLKSIDTNSIGKKDKLVLKILEFKNNFLPQVVIDFLRRIKKKSK